MKKLINWIAASFDTHSKGASARKLTAFSIMLCVGYCHIRFVDSSNVVEVLIIDLCGVLLCLGIVTAEQVIKLRNGNNETEATANQ